jgi:hypothetical protein
MGMLFTSKNAISLVVTKLAAKEPTRRKIKKLLPFIKHRALQ